MDAPCGLIILITVPTRSGKHELEESIACETACASLREPEKKPQQINWKQIVQRIKQSPEMTF